MSEVYEFTPSNEVKKLFPEARNFNDVAARAETLKEAVVAVIGKEAFDIAIKTPGIIKSDAHHNFPASLTLRDANHTKLGTFARIQ